MRPDRTNSGEFSGESSHVSSGAKQGEGQHLPSSNDSSRPGQSFDEFIDTCRQYLLMVANTKIDPQLRGKFGASDIVQETLITAHQEVRSFGGTTEDELRLWLRQILLNKLANVRRRYVHNAKREVTREMPITTSSQAEAPAFVDPNPTPRHEALSAEMHLAVRQAISSLSPRDQALIKLRSFELRSFAEIGQHLDMSSEAARKAWCRAIERFRVNWQRVNHRD